MSRPADAHWNVEQNRMAAFQHRCRAPAVGLLAGLLARAVPEPVKPTTTTSSDTKGVRNDGAA